MQAIINYDTTKFQPVDFSEREIITFKLISSCYAMCVSTDVRDTASPLYVDLHALDTFIKMHVNYWNRGFKAKSDDSIEQLKILKILEQKVKAVLILAKKYDVIINKTVVDLRRLMRIIKHAKTNNLELLKREHNDFNTMDIERVMLEQVKIELLHDIGSEHIVKDIIVFSKFMSHKVYGLYIK